MALPGMAPPMDGPEPGMDADAPPAGASPYAKAGRTIRHALADQDDEALGQAICDLVKIDGAQEPGADDGDGDMAPKKPNLALILASKGKGK